MNPSSLASFFSGINWTDPGPSIDAALRAAIKSVLPAPDATKYPAFAASVAAIEADAITCAEEALKAYALPKLLAEADKLAGPFMDSLAAKFTGLAPEINALKAKLAGT